MGTGTCDNARAEHIQALEDSLRIDPLGYVPLVVLSHASIGEWNNL